MVSTNETLIGLGILGVIAFIGLRSKGNGNLFEVDPLQEVINRNIIAAQTETTTQLIQQTQMIQDVTRTRSVIQNIIDSLSAKQEIRGGGQPIEVINKRSRLRSNLQAQLDTEQEKLNNLLSSF